MSMSRNDRIAKFVESSVWTIANALSNHAERMEQAAKEARTAYDAGQSDPEVKAAQDASLLTSNGLKFSAELFEQEAEKARKVCDDLQALLDSDD